MKRSKEPGKRLSDLPMLKDGSIIKKMIYDQERIHEAIKKGIPLSTLKDIKFVHPLQPPANRG